MATETLDVQHAGDGGAGIHEPPVDFFDPNRLLHRRNGIAMGALKEFGMREFDLRRFSPNREDTGNEFTYAEGRLGGLGMLEIRFDEGTMPNQN